MEGSAAILSRVAPMLPVYHAAAADAAGAVFRRGEDLRRQGMRELATLILGKEGASGRVGVDEAADLFHVLLGPETYRSFVLDLGWSSQNWVRWTANVLIRDLCKASPE